MAFFKQTINKYINFSKFIPLTHFVSLGKIVIFCYHFISDYFIRSGVFSLKKNHKNIRDLVYIHLNEAEDYVLTYGIEFEEWSQPLKDLLNHILLLKHKFDDVYFNMHTLLEYVRNEQIVKLVEEDVYGYGDFCWIDFEDVESLDELSGQDIAELLYLGHKKVHLKPPFYQILGNRYVYLAHDDGWWNKVYYRQMRDFYHMLSHVIGSKVTELKQEKGFFLFKKNKNIPPVHIGFLLNMKEMMKEGILISFRDMKQTRTSIEIPIWILGDFINMDDMYEEYMRIANTRYNCKLFFDKRTLEWDFLIR